MSNTNEYKTRFFDKIKFNEKTRVVVDEGASEILDEIMGEEFTSEQLESAMRIQGTFQKAAAGLFGAATQEMHKTLTANEEIGSLSLEVETPYGNLEVAMNRPEGGFTRDNIANATGLGITTKLDTDSFQEIYDDLDNVFDN